jgi:hypothetical protein
MHRACAVMGRFTLLAAFGLQATGCLSWKRQTVSPDQVLARNPTQVRVRLGNGGRLVVAQPTIIGDSLIGARAGTVPPNAAPPRLAVALADIQSLEVQRVNGGKTALLIAGLGITALVVIAAATYDGPFGDGPKEHPAVSCPLVYSWDGASWRLDSGTFGGAVAPALARTDLDNLVYATTPNGLLRLRVANELNETDYLDALSVLAVDHAPDVTVAPSGDGQLYALGKLDSPSSATDDRGNDALARVSAADGWAWESNPSGRDTSSQADIRDGLELVFAKPSTAEARLVVDGNNTPWAAHLTQELVAAHGRETKAWFDSLAAYPRLARGLGEMMVREAFLSVSVWSGSSWERQGYIWEAGPEISKRQVLPLDLSRVQGDTVRIRLESAPSFWLIDAVALGGAQNSRIEVHELQPQSARDEGGTDFGPLLTTADGRQYEMENGASAELRFQVPAAAPGLSRSYLVRSTGWYRIHTAELKTPDIALLQKVLTEPYGASRVAVGRMNDALLMFGGHP